MMAQDRKQGRGCVQDNLTAGTAAGRRMAGPVRSRTRWAVSGLAVQAAGLGGVTAFLWARLRHQDLGGHITAATFRLVWHGEIHTRAGLAVLITGGVIYAAGSIVLARPYVSRPETLFIAVPVAAVAGMVVLGAFALVAALLISALGDNLNSTGGGAPRRRTRRTRQ
jgi:hypothetical protein